VQNKKLPIRKIVSYLNDDEAEGGGFWLPNIQRPFVWNEDQIARLFDSIMREYPISTLLVWKTKEQVKHRKFIDNFLPDLKLTNFYVPDNTRSKMMVLDGQQRLQSLFIGLRGSYFGRELYFDVLSGVLAAPEDIRYRFAFKDKSSGVWPWVRFKDVVFQNNKLPGEIAEALVASCAFTALRHRQAVCWPQYRARKAGVRQRRQHHVPGTRRHRQPRGLPARRHR
jgi:hypothetical protein